MSLWKLLVPLMLSLSCGLTLAWTYGRDHRPSVRVGPGQLHGRVVVQAELVAKGGVAEVRPRTDGTVLRVLVSEGERVQAGQLLAELDSDDLRANVARSEAEARAAAASARSVAIGPRDEERRALEAEVEMAREQLEQAKDRARRSARLEQTGVEPEATAREVSRAEQIAQAQLARAEARLSQAKAGGSVDDVQAARERSAAASAASNVAKSVLGRTRLVSPIDGVVLSRHVDPGDTVLAARIDMYPAFELADTDRTELRLEAEEQDATRLALGQKLTVTLPGGRITVGRGQLTRLSNRLERRTIGGEEGRVRAETKVRAGWADWQAEQGRTLSLGQRAEAVVELAPRPVAALVPRSAVDVHDARAWVRVPSAFGSSERTVTLGEADDQFVEVFGLTEGTEVVADNH